MTQQQNPPIALEKKGASDPGRFVNSGGYKIRFQTLRVLFALLAREMTTTFGRSAAGYLWAVLEPIGVIVMFTIVFSVVFREPPVGTSFLLFYATGYLPFGLYNAGQSKISGCLVQNKMLLFYPAVKYVDVILARVMLIGLTEFTVALIVFSGVILTGETGARPDFLQIFTALIMALMLGSAVGMMNATLFEIMPSWRSVWRILSRPMFFVSGVFYVFEVLSPEVQNVLWWNPLVHIIGTMRRGMFPEYEGEYISVLYVVLVTLVIASIGLINLRTSNKFIINN